MTQEKNNIKVVVTGTEWMGSGVGSIETVMSELFKKAKNEIFISVYSIGTSSDLVFEWIEKALSRGVKIKMIINRLNEQPGQIKEQLKTLLLTFPHFELFEFNSSDGVDLHAKVIVVDHNKALVGSSNLSRRGLISNFEMGLLVEGPAANTVANTLNKLFENSAPINAEMI
jgi:cardiolipin synthase